MLLRKLPAWLYSIHANKVKPEIRDTVIKYQEECDDVLWDYWTKGVAINPRQTITPEQQAILHSIVDRRVNGFDSLRGGLWKRHNKHFGIAKYSQLLASRFDDAVVYLETAELRYPKPKEKINDGCYFLMAKDGVVIYQLPISQQVINSELANNKPLLLEHIKQVVGEFVGKEALPVPKPLVINLPRETARHTQNGANLFSLNILQRAYGVQGNPLAQLFGLLATAEQHHQPIIIKDIEGAKAIYDITKELAHQSQYALEMIAQTANKFCSGGSYFGNL